MILSDVCRVVAAETNQSPGRVMTIVRRLQEIDAIPKGPGGRVAAHLTYEDVALLLLALLVDEPSALAARQAVNFARFEHEDTPVTDYLAKLLKAANWSIDDLSVHAFKSNVTVHGGNEPAVVVRTTCTDKPFELAFTPFSCDYHPEEVGEIIRGYTLPGLVLHRVGRALSELR